MRALLSLREGSGRRFRRPLPLVRHGAALLRATILAALLLPFAVPSSLAQGGGTWRRHACLDCVSAVAATSDALWVATMSGDRNVIADYARTILGYVNATPDRVPFSDW